MDVAFVSNVVYPYVTGGAQKRIHEIGRRLVDRGHEVTVYGRRYWDGPRETINEGMRLRAVAPGRELYVDDDGRRSITEAVAFAARLTPSLARRLGDHDLVVASVFPYFPAITSALTGRIRNTPVVTTWHEVWLDYWDDYLERLAVGGKLVERLTARVPQRPVAVSGVTADRLARLGVDRERIEVIPNGIDTDRVANVTPTPDGDELLFAGRLIPEKRVSVLVAAFDRIADDYDVTLGIVGEGPDGDRVRQRAKEATHADRVTCYGFLDDYRDVLARMRRADVFVSPSVREGFGISYVEALAAGCTVIGADHPESAASEVIGDAGLVVDPTVDGVEAGLRRALDRPVSAATARSRATQFDWDRVVDTAEATYEAAVRGE